MKSIFLLGLIMSLSPFSFAENCLKVRAAFDIGSGRTKLRVAKVDVCKQRIIEMLHENDIAVEYKQSLKESKDNSFNNSIISYGISKIKQLKLEAEAFKPSLYIAVATSAFRTAGNGIDAAEEIRTKTGIKVNIISQNKEAKIGFVGASVISDNNLKDIIVWDIGGGSMQMTSYDGSGVYNIYEGKLASVSFKNHIIEGVQGYKLTDRKSPNPISSEIREIALRDAQNLAKFTIPSAILKKLSSPNVQVLGIGGVHYYNIGKVVSETKTYSLDMVERHIDNSLNMSDQELGGGKYVRTSLSNLILVEAFMKQLGIDIIKTGNVNMADGLLISPSLANE